MLLLDDCSWTGVFLVWLLLYNTMCSHGPGDLCFSSVSLVIPFLVWTSGQVLPGLR